METFRDCAIYALDTDGNIESWSVGTQLIEGYTEQEILGRNVSLFYTPDDLETGHHLRALERGRGEAWRASGKVLVIDDEDGVRVVARKTLEKCGLSVLTAHSGCEGVALFRLHASAIDAVLLDLTMPRMSGDVVLRELRRIRPDVRVIVSSGYDERWQRPRWFHPKTISAHSADRQDVRGFEIP